jgi:hypothetical protein
LYYQLIDGSIVDLQGTRQLQQQQPSKQEESEKTDDGNDAKTASQ